MESKKMRSGSTIPRLIMNKTRFVLLLTSWLFPFLNSKCPNKLDWVQTLDALWQSVHVVVSDLSFKWHNFMFLNPDVMLFKFIPVSPLLRYSTCVTDRRTDRQTDRQSSHRDARMYLITFNKKAYSTYVTYAKTLLLLEKTTWGT